MKACFRVLRGMQRLRGNNAERKKALLMDMGGEEIQDIFQVRLVENDGDDYRKAMTALDKHFTPKTNIPYERFVFR